MEIENHMVLPLADDEATPEREEPEYDKYYDSDWDGLRTDK